ncbi:aldolase/citrate lyase family protein [Emergencia timonensis]|uniref:HpcH/HpaI aldolase family protein n=2 Tax=Emergencia timonensis TaxID=1776384 RepID=UPI000829F22F|nr:aldolase/citrate lyase family protein [Emergencia timonensis]
MRKNLRTLLAENDCLFGCFVQIPSPEIVEMARHFDYVIIDGEHGHISHEQMLSMIRAAEAVDLAVMVRISDIDPILINQVLDMGITSLLVPNVSSKEDAVTLVDAAYYPPLGNRGACPFTRANYYGSDTPADYYKKTNEDLFIVATIEDAQGLAEMEDIISLDGIDCLGTGQFDLSVSLGVAGQIDHPKVREAAAKAEVLAEKHGKIYTSMIMEPSDSRDITGKACRLIMCGSPEIQIQNDLQDTAREARTNLQI